MRITRNDMDQEKVIDIYIKHFVPSVDKHERGKLMAACKDLMNHWAANTIIIKEPVSKSYDSSYLKPMYDAVHDHNASISMFESLISDVKKGTLDKKEIVKRIQRGIKENQNNFDIAYGRYKDLAVLDMARLRFVKNPSA